MRAIFQRHRQIILPLSAFVLIALVWELIVSVSVVPPIVLPGPQDVFRAALEEYATLWNDVLATFAEIVLAAVVAIVGGLLTGIAITVSPVVRRAVYPYVLMTQIMPKVALAPILVVWLGVGATSRLVLAVLIAYFPMVINTVTGLVTVKDSMLMYSRSLAASEWHVFAKVRLPHAIPAIVSGVKITVSVSVIGIIVGEFLASDRGLGRRIMDSSAVLNTPLTIAAILALGLIGLCLMALVELLERRLVFWQAVE